MKQFLLSLFIVVLLIGVSGCPTRNESKKEGEKTDLSVRVEINSIAPLFSLPDITGKEVNLQEFRGKVILLEFFTSWCLPCRIIAPDLRSLHQKYRDKEVVLIGISLKDDFNLSALQSFIDEYKLSFPVLIDDGQVSKIYGVFTLPTSFVIDRQGRLRHKHLGITQDYATMISKEIEQLM